MSWIAGGSIFLTLGSTLISKSVQVLSEKFLKIDLE